MKNVEFYFFQHQVHLKTSTTKFLTPMTTDLIKKSSSMHIKKNISSIIRKAFLPFQHTVQSTAGVKKKNQIHRERHTKQNAIFCVYQVIPGTEIENFCKKCHVAEAPILLIASVGWRNNPTWLTTSSDQRRDDGCCSSRYGATKTRGVAKSSEKLRKLPKSS